MSIIDELRYPRRWYTKLLIIILALIFFALLATLAISAVLTYWIVKPQRSSSEINLNTFPGRPDEVTFTVTGLGERQGWFFPGLVGAPTIVLLHGYESSRGELLTLVSALQDHQYNAFVFDFAAHGMNDGITTFGYREAAGRRPGALRGLGLQPGRLRRVARGGEGFPRARHSARFRLRLSETDGEDWRGKDWCRRLPDDGEVGADLLRVAELRLQGRSAPFRKSETSCGRANPLHPGGR